MKLPFFLGLVAMITILIVDCGDARNTTVLMAPAPYDGPYCSKLDKADYRAASDIEKNNITDAIAGVRDANREILWSHPAVNSLGIGLVAGSGGREQIGIRIGYDKSELKPGEPRPEDLIPKTIGCVTVQVRAGGTVCTSIMMVAGARVVDDQSGVAIRDAYWQSKTEEGVVLVETEEGGDHFGYMIANDLLLKDAVGLTSSVHPITVKVDKAGYQPAERIFQITTDRCHIQNGEHVRVIRLVRDNADPRVIVQAPPKPGNLPGSMLATAQVLAGVRLLDGRFLVTGGGNGQSMLDTQIYDPHTGTWSFSESMDRARPNGAATILSDGRVLVIGGVDRTIRLRSAEVFDVSTGKWSPATDMTEGRSNSTATLLQDGKVLVVGGGGLPGIREPVELYDPGSDT